MIDTNSPAIAALVAFARSAPANDPGEGTWDGGLDYAFAAGEMSAQYQAAKRIRAALQEMGIPTPEGRAVCSECGRYLSDGHANNCSQEASEGDECTTCADAIETRAAPCDECGHMDGEA